MPTSELMTASAVGLDSITPVRPAAAPAIESELSQSKSREPCWWKGEGWTIGRRSGSMDYNR